MVNIARNQKIKKIVKNSFIIPILNYNDYILFNSQVLPTLFNVPTNCNTLGV
jgi:hypothetical protein